MSLAIQDLTAGSRAKGLSDIMARHVDSEEVEKENNVTDIFGLFWVMPWTLPSASQGIDMMEESRSTLYAMHTMHVMSLAIQDLTPCSRAEGLSDIMARHMDGGEGEQCH